MLDPNFVFLAGIVDLLGVGVYALSTLRGHTKPNRVTWVLWAIIPLITLLAQLSEGVGVLVFYTFIIFLGPALVVLASFLNRDAYWKLSRFDIICGSLAVLAILLWIVTKDALMAFWLSLVADTVAGIPTLVKSYRYPETESANAYLAGIFSGGITLLTVQTWDVLSFVFPLYIMVFCILLYVLIKFPNLRPGKKLAPA